MDSRTALRGSLVSKQVLAIGLVIAAIVLGIGTAFAVRILQPVSARSSGYGAVTFAAGPAWDDSNRRHGTQSIGGSAVTSPAYREPSPGRGGPKD